MVLKAGIKVSMSGGIPGVPAEFLFRKKGLRAFPEPRVAVLLERADVQTISVVPEKALALFMGVIKAVHQQERNADAMPVLQVEQLFHREVEERLAVANDESRLGIPAAHAGAQASVQLAHRHPAQQRR